MFTGKKYNWLVAFTFIVPVLVALIYLYATGNKGVQELIEAPKIEIAEAGKLYNYLEDENNYITYNEEFDLITFEASEIIYDGLIINGKLTIENPPFFALDKKYYSIQQDEEGIIALREFNEFKIIQDNLVKKGVALGLNFMIGIPAVLFAIYMIMKRMDLIRKHRRLTALVSLTLTTMILLFLNLIIKNFFVMFASITISFGIYYIEWIIMRKKKGLPLTDEVVQKTQIVKEGD